MGHIVFTTVAGPAGWRGVKPTLDALIHVAAVRSIIKAGASHRIVRLTAHMAPADPTGEVDAAKTPAWKAAYVPDSA